MLMLDSNESPATLVFVAGDFEMTLRAKLRLVTHLFLMTAAFFLRE